MLSSAASVAACFAILAAIFLAVVKSFDFIMSSKLSRGTFSVAYSIAPAAVPKTSACPTVAPSSSIALVTRPATEVAMIASDTSGLTVAIRMRGMF